VAGGTPTRRRCSGTLRTAVEKIAKSENALFGGPPYDTIPVFSM